ncbi:hypothetical protein Ae201684P_020473 [Aphanomyces euteiches]|uniref:Uncharacterized protein n=1 Tax=Aphanomyces euteiches TaxID=100861 RepID=A0A6G0WGD8_9STRA|nr:hypothetical protein Ae201684_015598 [Aphanomyces euteiches]KAH9084222.1 hypothetical protein Ae201684P_020473 [Aphanomyces euteiches]KAH9155454.1 hypothetical protein AeRB84_002573 [Aphanomyces euteiches]
MKNLGDCISHPVDLEVPQCYLCMESTLGGENEPMELIAPCACQTYIHRECLDRWRITSNTRNAMTECPTCRSPYKTEVIPVDPLVKQQLFHARVWRSIVALAVIALGAVVLWLMDVAAPASWRWTVLDEILQQTPSTYRSLVFFGLSLAITAFIAGIFAIVAFFRDGCRLNGRYRGPDFRNVRSRNLFQGDSAAAVLALIVILSIICIGLYFIATTIVDGVGNAVDRRGARRIRELETRLNRIKNLRPLTKPQKFMPKTAKDVFS